MPSGRRSRGRSIGISRSTAMSRAAVQSRRLWGWPVADMTDRELGERLARVREDEKAAREYCAATHDLAERDAASIVVRHTSALRQSLEAWIGTRAIRAAMKS